MLNKKLVLGFICISLLSLCGCSVFMAAHKTGVSSEKLGECKTRGCILSYGATPIHVKKDKNGNVTEETYQVKKPSGSAARAAMHGALDVMTLGIWEVAGTPIEGTLNSDKFYSIKVIYNTDGETIKSIQLN